MTNESSRMRQVFLSGQVKPETPGRNVLCMMSEGV